MSNPNVSNILKPLGTLFRGIVGARNTLYDHGWIATTDCGAPVVSIGNLTAGGTGKTPFTALLVSELKKSGKHPLIVSRGYRSELEGKINRVEISDLRASARLFGDEPTMLARQLRDVPVYTGAEKLAVACRAVEVHKPDCVVADDAFQHRKLQRAFDIVLLDATEPWWHYRPLPAGRMREPFSALKRAHAVVMTKVNLAEPKRVERIRDQARASVDSSRLPVFLDVEYRVKSFESLSDFLSEQPAKLIPAESLRSEKLYLLSAIGRPETFLDLVRRETGAEIAGSRSFPDHYSFSKNDVSETVVLAKRAGATRIVVTEKDAVKLQLSDFGDFVPLVSRLEAVPGENWDEFRASLLGAIH
jgi:tetraacyldisaccharide 4'-kinase